MSAASGAAAVSAPGPTDRTATATATAEDEPTVRAADVTGTPFQVAIDCRDPHLLAAFWAAVLHLEVEDHDAGIRDLLAQGVAPPEEVIERDGRLAWRTAAACRSGDGRTRLLFQQVPEVKTTKNRLHLDVIVGEDRRDAEVSRLTDLGAARLWDGQQGPHRWVTLADPEGNEFCVG